MIHIEQFKSVPKPRPQPNLKSQVLQLVKQILFPAQQSTGTSSSVLKRLRPNSINYEFIYRNHHLFDMQNILDLAQECQFDFKSLVGVLSSFVKYEQQLILLVNVAPFEDLEQELLLIFKQKLMASFDFQLVLKELGQIRENGKNRDEFVKIVELLMKLNLYYSALEPKLIDSSIDYYRVKVQDFISNLEPAIMIREIVGLVNKDTENMPKSTLKLLEQKYFELLKLEFSQITDKCIDLIGEQSEFMLLVNLGDSCNCKSLLVSKIVAHIEKQQLVQFIPDLLELKVKVQYLQRDSLFSDQINKCFSDILSRNNHSSELLVQFIDKLLKKKEMEQMVEQKLSVCLQLFRLLKAKDLFEAFYGKSLAKRLLLDKSASVDAEKSMLIKLKEECGPGFTKKLEGMFKDMELSKDYMRSFNESKSFKKIKGMEFNVHVLTSGYWPSYPSVDLILPEQVETILIIVCQECPSIWWILYRETQWEEIGLGHVVRSLFAEIW